MLQPAARSFIVRLFRELQQPLVAVDPNAPLHLEEPSVVERLIKFLHRANRLEQVSLLVRRNPGQIVVSRMRFPEEFLAAALEPSHDPVPEFRAQGEPPLCIGDVLSLRANLLDELHGGAQRSDVALPSGLALHLGWHSGHFHVAASHDFEHFEGVITLDFAACTSAVMLHFREIDVIVNGPWQTCGTGLFAMTSGRTKAIAALSSGVPCVIHARGAHQSSQRPYGIAHSLHLDSIRR